MLLREIKPDFALASFVRLYRIIDFEFPDHNPIPPKAYTPRPEQCLQFFPTPTCFDYADGTRSIKPKNALLIGQHTVTNNRTIYQKFLSVQVVFQPGALYRLLGIPLHQLTNQLVEAGDVLGIAIEHVNDQLYHAQSHQQMVQIIEHYLMGLVRKVKTGVSPMEKVAMQMTDAIAQQPIDWCASNAFLCHRQFDRRFKDSVGISPKAYLRIIRFDKAYRMKNLLPRENWFNIAIACGYNDYQHLSKDYQDFTGTTPASVFDKGSPERLLGTEEVY